MRYPDTLVVILNVLKKNPAVLDTPTPPAASLRLSFHFPPTHPPLSPDSLQVIEVMGCDGEAQESTRIKGKDCYKCEERGGDLGLQQAKEKKKREKRKEKVAFIQSCLVMVPSFDMLTYPYTLSTLLVPALLLTHSAVVMVSILCVL